MAVRLLLARWFSGQVVAAERMGSGGSTPVYRVAVAGEEYYLRLAEGPGERRDGEVRVHELLRKRGVAVPAVLRWEREPPELDRSAALTMRMPGVPVAEFDGDASDALRRAGRDLARINAIPVSGYGWVDGVAGDDHSLMAEHPTRAAWAAEYLAAAETVIATGVFVRDRAETSSAALQTAIRAWSEGPDRAPSRLAHGDFDHSHIYVDPDTGAYEGIIDFGEIRGDDPLYDLGHALVHAGGATVDGLVAGYREIAPVEVDAVRLQAVASATRGLAIQLARPPSGYRDFLAARLGALLGVGR